MVDFDGKVVKVSLNSSYGIVCITGPFIKIMDNFLAVINPITNKIEYFSIYNIKSVTIVDDIKRVKSNASE